MGFIRLQNGQLIGNLIENDHCASEHHHHHHHHNHSGRERRTGILKSALFLA
jgi:hypothetical protein